jgi:hypothetical protein
MSIRNSLMTILCALASGCASVPDVTVSYYFPKAETQLTVTQTVGCSEKIQNKHRLIRSVISAAATTTNSADVDWLVDGKPRQGHFSYKAMNGTLSDGDATVTLTADGRLAGINATSTGQGDTIIKDLVTIAGTIAAFGGPPPRGPFVATVEDQACDEVDKYAANTQTTAAPPAKPAPPTVTLTYSVAVLYDVGADNSPALVVDQTFSPGYERVTGRQSSVDLVPDAVSKSAYDALRAILSDRMVTKLLLRTDAPHLRYQDTVVHTATGEGVPLELVRVAMMNVAITGHVGDVVRETQIWSGLVLAPTHNTYQLPVPTPATFGKTAFGLALSDSGTITSLHYGSNTGVPDTADAFGAIAKALQPKSPADRAKDIQGQADLIAQQQRLISCEVKPAQCK